MDSIPFKAPSGANILGFAKGRGRGDGGVGNARGSFIFLNKLAKFCRVDQLDVRGWIQVHGWAYVGDQGY